MGNIACNTNAVIQINLLLLQRISFMKAIYFIRLTILSFYTISCAGKNTSTETNDIDTTIAFTAPASDTFQPGKVITNVVCKNDATQSYALYIPAKGNKEILPVVYFFDPHGDGSMPLNKYKALANAYNFILIGSNNSKNGNDWSTAENIWSVLSDDSKKRLKINSDRIYICGFSGGAKVATYIALHHNEVKGVIANGAGLPDITNAGNFNFSFTAIAGEGDMNMTDLVAITNDLDKTQTKHRIIFFDGIHEWAPESTMNIAFAGLELDAIQRKLIPDDKAFISNYIDSAKKRINAYLKTNNYLKAQRECRLSINMLEGASNNVSWFKEEEVTITNNPSYQKQSQAKQELLLKEQNMKAVYEQQFQSGDMNYWMKTISDVKSKAKGQTSEVAMYQRLQAYLSLAFYSISNQLINSNENDNARYFVELYKMADAANSEAWYFSAILNARSNDAKATEEDLLKAVATGFADKNRLMQQAEFQKLGTQINLGEIESKIK